MKNKFGILCFILGLTILIGSFVFGYFQSNELLKKNDKLKTETKKIQKEIDALQSKDFMISKSEAVNTKDVGNSIAKIQNKAIKYYPKIVKNELSEKEKKSLSQIFGDYYNRVDITKKNDTSLYPEDFWYYNPNFTTTYLTNLNYAPGKIGMLWIIKYKGHICGIVTRVYDSDIQLISDLKVSLNDYGVKQNTNFKGYPKKEIEKSEQEMPDSVKESQSPNEADNRENESVVDGVTEPEGYDY